MQFRFKIKWQVNRTKYGRTFFFIEQKHFGILCKKLKTKKTYKKEKKRKKEHVSVFIVMMMMMMMMMCPPKLKNNNM